MAASKDDTEFFTTTSKDVAAKLGLTATGALHGVLWGLEAWSLDVLNNLDKWWATGRAVPACRSSYLALPGSQGSPPPCTLHQALWR